jgi:hypothetical protein
MKTNRSEWSQTHSTFTGCTETQLAKQQIDSKLKAISNKVDEKVKFAKWAAGIGCTLVLGGLAATAIPGGQPLGVALAAIGAGVLGATIIKLMIEWVVIRIDETKLLRERKNLAGNPPILENSLYPL